jgi:hypothetical protein
VKNAKFNLTGEEPLKNFQIRSTSYPSLGISVKVKNIFLIWLDCPVKSTPGPIMGVVEVVLFLLVG